MLKKMGVLVSNYLPLISCALYVLGAGADLIILCLVAISLVIDYKCCKKLSYLIFNFVNLIISAPLAVYINAQLYVHYVTDPTDYGTLLVGKIFMVVFLIIIIIASIILAIIKHNIIRKGIN